MFYEGEDLSQWMLDNHFGYRYTKDNLTKKDFDDLFNEGFYENII